MKRLIFLEDHGGSRVVVNYLDRSRLVAGDQ